MKEILKKDVQFVALGVGDPHYINRFKTTDDYNQGIFFYIKDIQTNEIWSATGEDNCDSFVTQFMPDKNNFEKINYILNIFDYIYL